MNVANGIAAFAGRALTMTIFACWGFLLAALAVMLIRKWTPFDSEPLLLALVAAFQIPFGIMGWKINSGAFLRACRNWLLGYLLRSLWGQ